MSLALIHGECSTGIPTIATNLTVASVELIKDNVLRLWFTLPVRQGAGYATDKNGYNIDGPIPSYPSLASPVSISDKAVDLYFEQNFVPGQWTILFISNYFAHNSIYIPSGTQYRFDIVNLEPKELPGLETDLNLTRKLINPVFKEKTNWEAIIAGLETGRVLLDEISQKAFNQAFISTASGKYLSTRASDNGISKPTALGITDNVFRELIITVLNRKLSKNAYLELLEVLYGFDSTHANIVSNNSEPYQLFDQATLDLVVDGKYLPIIFDWTNFCNASVATAQEVCQVLNERFEKLNTKAFATPYLNKILNKTFVKIYSGSFGLSSSVSVTGGTCQPIFNFGGSLFSVFPNDY